LLPLAAMSWTDAIAEDQIQAHISI